MKTFLQKVENKGVMAWWNLKAAIGNQSGENYVDTGVFS